MKNILSEERFHFLSDQNKAFILAFDNEILKLGYSSNNCIGDGYCWGKYMIIYSKVGVKNKQVATRIYIREDSIVLRLYLNKIDEHREYISNSKAFIKDVFTSEHGKCNHCHNDKDGNCKFRKTYTFEDKFIEKCNGITFEFWEPSLDKLPDYISLLNEFYPIKNKKPS